MTTKRIAAIGGAALIAGGLLVGVGATPALAATGCASTYFCDWDVTSFNGTRLAQSTATLIDVPNDRTQSSKNLSSSHSWSARNQVGTGDQEIAYFPAGYQLSSYGSNNNVVDNFNRVA